MATAFQQKFKPIGVRVARNTEKCQNRPLRDQILKLKRCRAREKYHIGSRNMSASYARDRVCSTVSRAASASFRASSALLGSFLRIA